MFRFLVIAALVPVMVFGISNLQVCLSGAPLPRAVRITGCDTAPCDLIIGTIKVMELDFIATFGLVAPRATIFVESYGMIGEYELPDDYALVCNRLTNTYCPLDEGENATFFLEMPVYEYCPITTMMLDISINNDAGQPITCFRFPAQTVM